MILQSISRHAIMLGVTAAGVFFSLLPSALATVVEQVVVVVDGEPYTLSDLKVFARTRLRREFSTQDFVQVDNEGKELLEQFITEKLIAGEIKRLGINVSNKDIDGYIDRVKERARISNDQLRAALRREGVSMEEYRASIRAQLEKGELINRQVEKRVNITPEDVRRYYRTHSRRFMTKDKVHLSHILFRVLEGTPDQVKAAFSRALEVRERALRGEDFGQLARKYSDGAGASAGGNIGWVDRASLLNEIAEVAFTMSPGEISQPVRTSLGVHLLKLEGRRSAKLLPLSQVGRKIKEVLYAKALEERFQRWLKTDLRKKHRVDVRLPGFVFRAEETREGTVKSLMASASLRSDSEEHGFWSYLNPLSYIMSETPVEDETGENLAGESIVSLFGVPVFVTESADSVEEEPLIQPEEREGSGESEESQGFFSSIWDSISPF
ncbi:MAG: peptidylprolyl isomerase [Candidatus Binatia bacterium]